MSATISPRQIVRCPLCRDGGAPDHLDSGVMYCASCGQRYRVVSAVKGKTGKKLSAVLVKREHELTSRMKRQDALIASLKAQLEQKKSQDCV